MTKKQNNYDEVLLRTPNSHLHLISDEDVSPSFLDTHLAPYLKDLVDLQYLIDGMNKRPKQAIEITEINRTEIPRITPKANTKSENKPLYTSNLPSLRSDEKNLITNTLDEVEPTIFEKSPIPYHENQSNSFVWYQVNDRQDLEGFLPDIQADSALLVDTRIELYDMEERTLVIVEQKDANGSISLKPILQQEAKERPMTRIFLAEVDEPFSFTRDPETGEVQIKSDDPEESNKIRITPNQTGFPIFAEEIIGIVIGIWSKLHLAEKETYGV